MLSVRVTNYTQLVDCLSQEHVPTTIVWDFEACDEPTDAMVDSWRSKLNASKHINHRIRMKYMNYRDEPSPVFEFVLERLSHYVFDLDVRVGDVDEIGESLIHVCAPNLKSFAVDTHVATGDVDGRTIRIGENVARMLKLTDLRLGSAISVSRVLRNVGRSITSLSSFTAHNDGLWTPAEVLGRNLKRIEFTMREERNVFVLNSLLNNSALSHVELLIRSPYGYTNFEVDAYWSKFIENPNLSHDEICRSFHYGGGDFYIDLVGAFSKLTFLKELRLRHSDFPLIGVVVRNALRSVIVLDVSFLRTKRSWDEITAAFLMMRFRTHVRIVDMNDFEGFSNAGQYEADFIHDHPSGCPISMHDASSYEFITHHPTVNFIVGVLTNEIQNNIMLQRQMRLTVKAPFPHEILENVVQMGLHHSVGSAITWVQNVKRVPVILVEVASDEPIGTIKTIAELVCTLLREPPPIEIHWEYDLNDNVPSNDDITNWNESLKRVTEINELKLVLSVVPSKRVTTLRDADRRLRLEKKMAKRLSRLVTDLTITRCEDTDHIDQLIKKCSPNLSSFSCRVVGSKTNAKWLGQRISEMVLLSELNVHGIALKDVLDNVDAPIDVLMYFTCSGGLTAAPLRILGTHLIRLSINHTFTTMRDPFSEINQISALMRSNPGLKSLSLTELDVLLKTETALSTAYWNRFVADPEMEDYKIRQKINYEPGSDCWIDLVSAFLALHHLEHLDLSSFDFPLIGVIVRHALKGVTTLELRGLNRRKSWDQIVGMIKYAKNSTAQSIDLSDFRGLREYEPAAIRNHPAYAAKNTHTNSDLDFMIGHPTVKLTIGGFDTMDVGSYWSYNINGSM